MTRSGPAENGWLYGLYAKNGPLYGLYRPKVGERCNPLQIPSGQPRVTVLNWLLDSDPAIRGRDVQTTPDE